jgi:hypothetical protein
MELSPLNKLQKTLASSKKLDFILGEIGLSLDIPIFQNNGFLQCILAFHIANTMIHIIYTKPELV